MLDADVEQRDVPEKVLLLLHIMKFILKGEEPVIDLSSLKDVEDEELAIDGLNLPPDLRKKLFDESAEMDKYFNCVHSFIQEVAVAYLLRKHFDIMIKGVAGKVFSGGSGGLAQAHEGPRIASSEFIAHAGRFVDSEMCGVQDYSKRREAALLSLLKWGVLDSRKEANLFIDEAVRRCKCIMDEVSEAEVSARLSFELSGSGGDKDFIGT